MRFIRLKTWKVERVRHIFLKFFLHERFLEKLPLLKNMNVQIHKDPWGLRQTKWKVFIFVNFHMICIPLNNFVICPKKEESLFLINCVGFIRHFLVSLKYIFVVYKVENFNLPVNIEKSIRNCFSNSRHSEILIQSIGYLMDCFTAVSPNTITQFHGRKCADWGPNSTN